VSDDDGDQAGPATVRGLLFGCLAASVVWVVIVVAVVWWITTH
jgi:hypothetical protein